MKEDLSIIYNNRKLYQGKLWYNSVILWFIFSNCAIKIDLDHNYTLVLWCHNNLDIFLQYLVGPEKSISAEAVFELIIGFYLLILRWQDLFFFSRHASLLLYKIKNLHTSIFVNCQLSTYFVSVLPSKKNETRDFEPEKILILFKR